MNQHRLNLKSLRFFESAARHGSLTKAADELHVTQSAVSKQITQLEENMGERLFVRKAQGLALTAAGEALLTPLQQAFNLIHTAVWRIENNKSIRRIRINAPATFSRRWLAQRLAPLQNSFPDTQVHLSTLLDAVDDSDLKEHDFSIRFGAAPWPGLSCELLFQEQHIAVCAPQLLDPKHKDMLDIHSQNLIHIQNCEMSWSRWLHHLKIESIDTTRGLYFDVQDMAIKAAMDAHGIALVDSNMVQKEMRDGLLVQWKTQTANAHTAYWLVCKYETLERDGMRDVHNWLLRQGTSA